MDLEDAKKATNIGADGIIVSNMAEDNLMGLLLLSQRYTKFLKSVVQKQKFIWMRARMNRSYKSKSARS